MNCHTKEADYNFFYFPSSFILRVNSFDHDFYYARFRKFVDLTEQ